MSAFGRVISLGVPLEPAGAGELSVLAGTVTADVERGVAVVVVFGWVAGVVTLAGA